MIAGAVDIGTNSVRLIIAGEKDGSWQDLVRTVEITRLGEGVDRTRTIKPEAMERTITVLAGYKKLMGDYHVEKSKLVSTSAMRDAKNATEFKNLVKECLDMDIEVISGEEEGRLTFAGAVGQDTLAPKNEVALVVDIGGGSTEYIYGKDGEIYGATSLNVGSVRLTEHFFKHDPPAVSELWSARQTIRELAEPVFKKIADANPAVMIAVAGTATQLAAVYYSVEPYDSKKIHGSKIALPELNKLVKKLASIPTGERKKLKGMHPQRADVVVGGALILEETMQELCLNEVIISEKDILDGLIYSIA